MTPLRDAAESATAGVPVVREGDVVGWMHPTAGWCHHSVREVIAHCQNGGPLPIPLVPLSALDTARAANEALMVERTNLIETKRDQLAQAQSALTAAQERIAELEADKRRMDWLVSQDVDVRTPLVYGSRMLFAAQAVGGLDADDPYRTTLREQIDATLSPAVKEPK